LNNEVPARWREVLRALRLPPNGDPLNDEQQESVFNGLRSRVQLLQGPPGTGKTTVTSITTLVKAYQYCVPGDVVFVAAHTHTAVDNVLLRIRRDMEAFQQGADAQGFRAKPLRLAKIHSSDPPGGGDPGIIDLSATVRPVRDF
jgi:hypothetical protein